MANASETSYKSLCQAYYTAAMTPPKRQCKKHQWTTINQYAKLSIHCYENRSKSDHICLHK